MKVFVLSREGKPLMPTTPCRARHLLKAREAEVERMSPYTIRMLIKTSEVVQPVTLGIDAGSGNIGISASTVDEEVFSAEVTLRDDIPRLMTARRQSRRTRRSRLRHRQPRFSNRKRLNGWLTPTMEAKIRAHESAISLVCSILPISKIVIETASFDIQRIRNPDITGEEYQQGEQLGYENVKAYVKARDGYMCRSCASHEHLEVHHIIQRKDGGGNSPDNLVTLCHDCHRMWHEGTSVTLHDHHNSAFMAMSDMSTMRWFLLDSVRKAHPNIPVEQTYGYITNWSRNQYRIGKSHANDAFCIAGNFKAERSKCIYDILKVRCHNRQVMKLKISKGGKLKRNQAPKLVMGIARYDVVRHEDGRVMIVTARKTRGLYSLNPLDGSKTLTDVPRKRFSLLCHSNGEVIARRSAFPTSGQA